ncbi:AAA family ATPase [Candidatus Azambacteria bacterium]|nr:AAA family ATPase [Candidatus Azambacteria bacterium]
MTQEQALSILKTGANVFLTGAPGSGKTHTVNEYVAYLRARGVEPAITASTGIAATHIGGMTIHSWSGIGIRTKLSNLGSIATSDYIAKRVRRAKVLIIDEVSMLAPGTLAMVDAVCREIKQSEDPFGGIQIVMVGDFFQLPPIVKVETEGSVQGVLIEETAARFAYDSSAWVRARPIVCYLTEQHRQDDTIFLNLLSAIRCNAFSGDHLGHLETRRVYPFDFAHGQSRACRGVERHTAPQSAPKLFSHNIDVDRVNDEMLATLSGKSHAFGMSSQGPHALATALQRGCLSPETLYLKIGASVMFTKNNPKEGFANGMLGVVEAFDAISGYPIIVARNGVRITVEPMDWTVEENGKVRARIAQLPLRLAWAITVHKSQGMSLDAAVMDLSAVFEFGQGYVALSRVRRLSGLYLLGWNERAFLVHPDVVKKDESFRAASFGAEAEFSDISPTKLQKMQEDFIIACGGKKRAKRRTSDVRHRVSGVQEGKNGGGGRFDKLREKHPNAYRPWDKAQDKKLEELFAEGVATADLVKTFGRKGGAIRSRLIKLGLVEE